MTTLVVITDAGNVFGANVNFATTTVEPVFEFSGAKIGFNPQDRFMVATDDTLFVITNTGDVFWADVDIGGQTLGPVSHLGGAKIGFNPLHEPNDRCGSYSSRHS
jgi:hypothetical protein